MTEEKNLLEGYDPSAPLKPKPNQEQLSEATATIDFTPATEPRVPGWLWLTQAIAITYILVNVLFVIGLIAARNSSTGIVAAYMLPLTVLLLLLIYAIGELKKIARGEKG